MRRQLPVYSPLSAGAIASAAMAALRDGDGERARLAGELQRRFKADRVILTASGTQALQLALSGLSATDEDIVVALPGYSCYDLVTAAVGAGVRVRFYDVDPVTLTPDVGSVRRVLRAGVSALVAANLYGYPLNWGDLRSECEAAGVLLIEDAAQGIGAVSDRGPGGTLGDATVLSFGRGKGWTGGGGGALLLRSDGVHRLTKALEPSDDDTANTSTSAGASGDTRPQRGGWGVTSLLSTGVAWALGRPSLYRIPTSLPGLGLGETHYRDPKDTQGIATFTAALTRRSSEASAAAILGRREIAARWMRVLAKSLPQQTGGGGHQVYACRPESALGAASFLRLSIVFHSPAVADSFVASERDRGVARGYPIALHRLPQSAALQLEAPPHLSGSQVLASSLVTVPTHQWVTVRDERAIWAALQTAARRAV